jgi:hypothetical protein
MLEAGTACTPASGWIISSGCSLRGVANDINTPNERRSLLLPFRGPPPADGLGSIAAVAQELLDFAALLSSRYGTNAARGVVGTQQRVRVTCAYVQAAISHSLHSLSLNGLLSLWLHS